jgi:hypothetical protein
MDNQAHQATIACIGMAYSGRRFALPQGTSLLEHICNREVFLEPIVQ